MPAPVRMESSPERLRDERRLFWYLMYLREHEFISGETRVGANAAWERLAELTEGRLPVPNASAGLDETLLPTWNTEDHHLVCDGCEREAWVRNGHLATMAWLWAGPGRPDRPRIPPCLPRETMILWPR